MSPHWQNPWRSILSTARGMRYEWLFLIPAVFLLLVLFDIVFLVAAWPDWQALERGPVPKSRFISEFEAARQYDKKLPVLRWAPIAGNRIPKHVARAFIVAEDARFYLHDGIDLEAVSNAIKHNVSKGRVVFGASTISQQTVKNLLLTRERSLLRKWHELVLTRAMESNLSKHRILSIYLNVIELGRGVYGIEAGAQHYFGCGAAGLTSGQAAALAATLPSPKNHNPATNTKTFARRHEKVKRFLREMKWDLTVQSEVTDEPPQMPSDDAPRLSTEENESSAPEPSPAVLAPDPSGSKERAASQ